MYWTRTAYNRIQEGKKEERENKEKRRENEQTAISTVSQATDTHR